MLFQNPHYWVMVSKPMSSNFQLLMPRLQNAVTERFFVQEKKKKEELLSAFLTIPRTPCAALPSGANIYLLLFWDEATSFKRATFVSAGFVHRLVYPLLFLLVLRGMCVFRTCPLAHKHAINNVFLRCLFLQFLAVHFYPGIKSLNVPFFSYSVLLGHLHHCDF